MKTLVKKYSLGQEPEDVCYWQDKTMKERLEALETIRQQYINFFMNGVQPRFQKDRIVIRNLKQY